MYIAASVSGLDALPQFLLFNATSAIDSAQAHAGADGSAGAGSSDLPTVRSESKVVV